MSHCAWPTKCVSMKAQMFLGDLELNHEIQRAETRTFAFLWVLLYATLRRDCACYGFHFKFKALPCLWNQLMKLSINNKTIGQGLLA
jgi:hypothetical protein